MTKKTHLVVGLASTLPLLNVMPFYALVGLIGATFADIDIKFHIKHRTVTHGFIALILCASLVMFLNKNIGLVFGFNYAIHLILDSFTKMGVPLFYPYKKYYGLKFMKTGDPIDLFVRLISIFFIFK